MSISCLALSHLWLSITDSTEFGQELWLAHGKSRESDLNGIGWSTLAEWMFELG